jgi:hypothetical protein
MARSMGRGRRTGVWGLLVHYAPTRRPSFRRALSWPGGFAVRGQRSGARFLPSHARGDPHARYLRQRNIRNGLSRLGLGRASFVAFDPSLTSIPHEACRLTKKLQRELKHPAIFPKRCAAFVVTSPTCDDSRLVAGDCRKSGSSTRHHDIEPWRPGGSHWP